MKHVLFMFGFVSALSIPAAAQHGPHHGDPGGATLLSDQIERVRETTAVYRDHAAAVRDGYKLFGREAPLMGEHWYRPDLVRQPLDLSQPSTLQYAVIDGKRVLVGVAYTVYRRSDDPMPEGFAGTEDHWHVHDVPKLARTLVADRPVLRWITERRIANDKMGGGSGRTHLTMVHAWIWLDNPEGMFAQDHPVLPYRRAGLPASFARRGQLDAARGIALLGADACEGEIKRTDALAGLDRDQRLELRAACEEAAQHVRKAMASTIGAEKLNRSASRSWESYQRRRAQLLRQDQIARLDSVVGHH